MFESRTGICVNAVDWRMSSGGGKQAGLVGRMRKWLERKEDLKKKDEDEGKRGVKAGRARIELDVTL